VAFAALLGLTLVCCVASRCAYADAGIDASMRQIVIHRRVIGSSGRGER
jgi:hypothetical protein